MPDEPLLASAAEGRLRPELGNSGVETHAQGPRKSAAFVENFVGQCG